MKRKEQAGIGFDERLERLEELAERIRGQDISLEDALVAFEEGMRLSKGIEKDLSKIEGRIEILMNDPDRKEDEPEIGLFDQP